MRSEDQGPGVRGGGCVWAQGWAAVEVWAPCGARLLVGGSAVNMWLSASPTVSGACTSTFLQSTMRLDPWVENTLQRKYSALVDKYL